MRQSLRQNPQSIEPPTKQERRKHSLPIGGAGSNPIGKRGRPLIYDAKRFPHIAKILSRNYGCTHDQLADIFGVPYKTFIAWVYDYPEMRSAITEGRDTFDSINVENALLKRAMGYQFTERTYKRIRVKGKDMEGHVVHIPATEITETIKELPPDPKSAMFWLANRNSDRWKLQVNVKNEGTIKHQHSGVVASAQLENLNKDQLLALREMIAVQGEGKAPIEITGQQVDDEVVPLQLEHILNELGFDGSDDDYSNFG